MAFTNVTLKAFGIDLSEPIRKRTKQVLLISGNCAATDVTHDLSAASGALLTALSSAQSQAFSQIQTSTQWFDGLESPQLSAKQPVSGGPAAGQYSTAFSLSQLPIVTYATSDAPTAFKYSLEVFLVDDQVAIRTIDS